MKEKELFCFVGLCICGNKEIITSSEAFEKRFHAHFDYENTNNV
jgi:hypothetical protein